MHEKIKQFGWKTQLFGRNLSSKLSFSANSKVHLLYKNKPDLSSLYIRRVLSLELLSNCSTLCHIRYLAIADLYVSLSEILNSWLATETDESSFMKLRLRLRLSILNLWDWECGQPIFKTETLKIPFLRLRLRLRPQSLTRI